MYITIKKQDVKIKEIWSKHKSIFNHLVHKKEINRMIEISTQYA